MVTIIIRTIIMYVVLVVCIRLMGKRQIAELQPSELVVTIMISNIATLSMEETDRPLRDGLTPVLSLVAIDLIMSWVSLRFPAVNRLVSGSPKKVIKDGRIDEKALRRLRFTKDDLYESLRTQQVFDVSTVKSAIVETNGQLSVELIDKEGPGG